MLALRFFLFAFCAAFVVASAVEYEKRQNAGDVINSLTSQAGGVIDDITSGFSVATSVVVDGAGNAFTVVTAAGGSAITLAASGAGVATSFAGSQYTIATGRIASITSGLPTGTPTNAASSLKVPFGVSSVVGVATMILGVAAGVILTLN